MPGGVCRAVRNTGGAMTAGAVIYRNEKNIVT